MKLNRKFILRQVVGKWLVLPLGEATLDFNGMLTLNESGVLLWNALERDCDREALIEVLTNEYDVSRETALADVDEFLDKLAEIGCVTK